LVRHLAKRAEALKQVYAREAEEEAVVAVTTLVTSLAMNFVHRGAYFPEAPPPAPEAPPPAPEPPPPTAEAAEPPKAAEPRIETPEAAEPRVETPEAASEPPPAESPPPSEREELKRASR
jgi:hypothetical protein